MATQRIATRRSTQRDPAKRQAQTKRFRPSPGWWALAVAAVTFTTYLPALNNGFVNWDDLHNIVDNPNYRGLGWAQLQWMFSTFHLSLYRPVTWMTFALDYLVWDMNPFGYHLTSALLHAANTALFFVIALRLMRRAPALQTVGPQALILGAVGAALFFSLHPLRVEAVAWVSARNDVVSGTLILATVYCYLRAMSAPSEKLVWLSAALVVYVFSLLAKSIGMTLPVVLLLLDIYPLRRLPGMPHKWFTKEVFSVLREKIPFFIFAFGAGVVSILAKQEGQVFHGFEKYGLSVRLAETFYGLAFYLWKSVAPWGLSPLYQRAMDPQLFTWPFVLSAAVVLSIAAALIHWGRSWPAASMVWFYYLVTLFPVLGIVQFGHQVVADRYSYISCMGWALLAGAGLASLWKTFDPVRARRTGRALVLCVTAAVLFTLGFLTWRQVQIWHDSEKLWRHALALDPWSSLANNNLAAELKRQHRLEEASEFLHRAVKIDPRYAQAHHNLGDVKAQQGKFEEAVEHYQRALTIDPRSALTHHHLGTALAAGRRFDDALKSLFLALGFSPDNAKIYDDLGNTMMARDDLVQAEIYYRKAIALDSRVPAPYLNLGNLYLRKNQMDQASFYYRQALDIDPSYAQAHVYLGRLLAAQGQLDEAANHFRHAVKVEPSHIEAHRSLIEVLLDQGKNDEAKRYYYSLLKLLDISRHPAR